MFTCMCLGASLLPQSYQYPNILEGADRIGGQLRGDKECPFSCVNQIWQSSEEGVNVNEGKRCFGVWLPRSALPYCFFHSPQKPYGLSGTVKGGWGSGRGE